MAKILVVEDEQFLNNLYSELLEMKGHEVFKSFNGQDALNILEEQIPDLILLDVNMPITDGIEFLAHIKMVNRLKRIPVLLITGIAQLEKISRCLHMGAIGYIEKASSPIEVMNKIDLIMGAVVQIPKYSRDFVPERQDVQALEVTGT